MKLEVCLMQEAAVSEREWKGCIDFCEWPVRPTPEMQAIPRFPRPSQA